MIPTLGSDTRALLNELGYSDAEAEKLIDARVAAAKPVG
jgi:crotonobetainyl-CoA:carnitine CoA-transferase CaiB-like acyl-CoA transferase